MAMIFITKMWWEILTGAKHNMEMLKEADGIW